MSQPVFYQIIRVKRKLNEDANDPSTDRYQSFKRLRHIGSFSTKHDEESLNSSQLLNVMGFTKSKRIKISELNSEQFSAYVGKFDAVAKNADDNKVTEQVGDSDHNSLWNIQLDPNELLPKSSDSSSKPNDDKSEITLNGETLQCVTVDTKTDQYLYDYFILMDDLIDLQSANDENENQCYDDDEASSNDENYRYNDYPDEDEFNDDDDESHTDSDASYREGYRDDYDSEDICHNFDRFGIDSDKSSSDGSHYDDDYIGTEE